MVNGGKSLADAAKAQGLTVQKSAPIARGETPPVLPPEPVLTTSFVDSHVFELGGRRFELYDLAADPGDRKSTRLNSSH